jgi:hypothetical protein
MHPFEEGRRPTVDEVGRREKALPTPARARPPADARRRHPHRHELGVRDDTALGACEVIDGVEIEGS